MKNKKYIRANWSVDDADGMLIINEFVWVSRKGKDDDEEEVDYGCWYFNKDEIVEELDNMGQLDQLEYAIENSGFEFDLLKA